MGVLGVTVLRLAFFGRPVAANGHCGEKISQSFLERHTNEDSQTVE
jgi:hypothetical protein